MSNYKFEVVLEKATEETFMKYAIMKTMELNNENELHRLCDILNEIRLTYIIRREIGEDVVRYYMPSEFKLVKHIDLDEIDFEETDCYKVTFGEEGACVEEISVAKKKYKVYEIELQKVLYAKVNIAVEENEDYWDARDIAENLYDDDIDWDYYSEDVTATENYEVMMEDASYGDLDSDIANYDQLEEEY